MIGLNSNLPANRLHNSDWLNDMPVRVCAVLLTGAAILSSAFHFWPFEDHKIWPMICLPNMAVLVWGLLLFGFGIQKRRWPKISRRLPHVSVFAYLIINVLSTAFALKQGRAIGFTAKLILMLAGGYMLFCTAVFSRASLRLIYRLAVFAAIISVSGGFVSRLIFGTETFGFHRNVYKYGTFIAILVPLASTYLLASPSLSKKLAGMALTSAALVSIGSVGAMISLVIGLVVALVTVQQPTGKLLAMSCLIGASAILVMAGSGRSFAPLANDMKLAETDQTNLKQRYIEWQAEINLLEERTITGTGAGCINEYRSKFYYRLPKLNTLKAYDQNGWLATAAETGLVGLVCFCWISVHYFALALRRVVTTTNDSSNAHKYAAANIAALTAAITANCFSSVNYNGVLIAFVLVLALISNTERLFKEQEDEENQIH